MSSFSVLRRSFNAAQEQINQSIYKVLSEHTKPKDCSNFFSFVKDFKIPNDARKDLNFDSFIEAFSSEMAQTIEKDLSKPLPCESMEGASALPVEIQTKTKLWNEGNVIAVASLLRVENRLLSDDERVYFNNNIEKTGNTPNEGRFSTILDKIMKSDSLANQAHLTREIVWRIIREEVFFCDPVPDAPGSSAGKTVEPSDEEKSLALARKLQEEEDRLLALSLKDD